MLRKIISLFFWIAVCQFAGIIGSFFTYPAIKGWYASLNKPFFNPPNWVFAPVWTLLYTLMGLSIFLILQAKRRDIHFKSSVAIFWIQLFLNSLWSYLFFGLKSPGIAFLEILILWLFIGLMIIRFYKISPLAGFLQLPYFGWVSFAAVLNYFVWVLNI